MTDLIQPVKKGEELLQDIYSTHDGNERHFYLWWLGQSGFLLQWRGRHVLIDPYLSDSLTKKYADTDKPHIRMMEIPIKPRYLNFIDVVTSSHNHTDHLDAETLMPILRQNPSIEMVIPEANREFVANRLHFNPDFPIGLNAGACANINPFTITGIPAAHNEIERDENGFCKFLGYVIEFGPWVIYHSGDTLWREEIIEALSAYRIDMALLPINGNKPERRVAGNLNPREAAEMGKTIGARRVIPCHYHMFTFNTEDPANFVREAERVGQAYDVLECGERWSSERLDA